MNYFTVKIKTLRSFEMSTGSNIPGDLSIQNNVVRNSDLPQQTVCKPIPNRKNYVCWRYVQEWRNERKNKHKHTQTNKHIEISAQIHITFCLEGNYYSSVNSDVLDNQGSAFSRSKILLLTNASRLLLKPNQFLIQRLQKLFPQRWSLECVCVYIYIYMCVCVCVCVCV